MRKDKFDVFHSYYSHELGFSVALFSLIFQKNKNKKSPHPYIPVYSF